MEGFKKTSNNCRDTVLVARDSLGYKSCDVDKQAIKSILGDTRSSPTELLLNEGPHFVYIPPSPPLIGK